MTYFNPDPKKYSAPKVPKGLKQKSKEPTGELAMFKEIFVERKGICAVTSRPITFHPMSFMHILSKGAYPKFRLVKKNIVMVIPEIHDMYDNGGKEWFLSQYPKAQFIYDLKEELKIEYHKPQPTI